MISSRYMPTLYAITVSEHTVQLLTQGWNWQPVARYRAVRRGHRRSLNEICAAGCLIQRIDLAFLLLAQPWQPVARATPYKHFHAYRRLTRLFRRIGNTHSISASAIGIVYQNHFLLLQASEIKFARTSKSISLSKSKSYLADRALSTLWDGIYIIVHNEWNFAFCLFYNRPDSDTDPDSDKPSQPNYPNAVTLIFEAG